MSFQAPISVNIPPNSAPLTTGMVTSGPTYQSPVYRYNNKLFVALTFRPVGGSAIPASFQVWQSTDNGNTWSEADAANRDTDYQAGSLPLVCSTVSGQYLYMFHYSSAGSANIAMRRFDMATGLYGTVYPYLPKSNFQSTATNSIFGRPDGSIVTAGSAYISSLYQYWVTLNVFHPDTGTWDAYRRIYQGASGIGYQTACMGADGRFHIVWKDGPSSSSVFHHGCVNSDGTLRADNPIVTRSYLALNNLTMVGNELFLTLGNQLYRASETDVAPTWTLETWMTAADQAVYGTPIGPRVYGDASEPFVIWQSTKAGGGWAYSSEFRLSKYTGGAWQDSIGLYTPVPAPYFLPADDVNYPLVLATRMYSYDAGAKVFDVVENVNDNNYQYGVVYFGLTIPSPVASKGRWYAY